MRKTAVGLVGVLAASAMLVGCGGSEESSGSGGSASGDYCDILKTASSDLEEFTGASAPSEKSFNTFIDRLNDVTDAAPSEVADEWKTINSGVKELQAALEDAGISFDDLAGAMGGQLPEGVSMQDLQAVGEEIQKLNAEDFQAATKAIADNAKTECKVDLENFAN